MCVCVCKKLGVRGGVGVCVCVVCVACVCVNLGVYWDVCVWCVWVVEILCLGFVCRLKMKNTINC